MTTMFWAQALLAEADPQWYAARQRWVRPEPAPPAAPGQTASRAAAEQVWRDVRRLRDAGIPILAGSLGGQGLPALAGAALHDELALLVRAGFSPREALAAATTTPAAVIARLYPRVRAAEAVATGEPADLVLLDRDPLVDIANTRRIRAVVANGLLYDRAALDGLLADAAPAAAAPTAAAPAR
jgi:imidazolonepropionase-like amidohydrolase